MVGSGGPSLCNNFVEVPGPTNNSTAFDIFDMVFEQFELGASSWVCACPIDS